MEAFRAFNQQETFAYTWQRSQCSGRNLPGNRLHFRSQLSEYLSQSHLETKWLHDSPVLSRLLVLLSSLLSLSDILT